MKYCQIVPSLEERHGGPSKSALGLATALADLGGGTELVATEPHSAWSRSEGGLEIKVFKRSWPKALGASAGLRSHLKAVTTSVVHHHAIWLRTLHYAHLTAKRLDVPFVVSPRGMMNAWAWNHHSKRKAFARAVVHPGAFEAVDGWHATSEEEADSIRVLGFRQPVCVAPNGVSVPSLEAVATSAAAWRDIIDAQPGRPIALFYSRFHKKKRLIELIDCWIENAPADWLLVIAGIPEDYTPSVIDGYVLRAGGAGRIRAYNGAGRPPPYGVASLFLLPSHSENFGLSIAEALAHGVPAIVTDTTPWKGLDQKGAGWCVPWSEFGNAVRLATAEDSEALRIRGRAGREWVRKEYSWARWAPVLSDFYASLRT